MAVIFQDTTIERTIFSAESVRVSSVEMVYGGGPRCCGEGNTRSISIRHEDLHDIFGDCRGWYTDEHRDVIVRFLRRPTFGNDARQIFHMTDKDNSGYLEWTNSLGINEISDFVSEFCALERIRPPLIGQQIQLFQKFDNGDGKLGLEEAVHFAHAMLSGIAMIIHETERRSERSRTPPFMRFHGVDIGTFSEHSSTPGVEFLKGKTPTMDDLQAVVAVLGAVWGSNFTFIPKTPVLNQANCEALISMLDKNYHGEKDLKLTLSETDLAAVIGEDAVVALKEQFGERFDEICLRRVEAHGECINFHTDYSKKTMQISLNNDKDYVGGKLAFITDSGLEIPERTQVSATIHTNKIVHGVTKLESGVRYALFFLQKF